MRRRVFLKLLGGLVPAAVLARVLPEAVVTPEPVSYTRKKWANLYTQDQMYRARRSGKPLAAQQEMAAAINRQQDAVFYSFLSGDLT